MKLNDIYFKYSLLPPARLLRDYPFEIWAAGLICFVKGTLWVFLPNSAVSPNQFLFAFYLFFGISIWNLRLWAWWALLVLCATELVLYTTPWFPLMELGPLNIGGIIEYISAMASFMVGPLGTMFIILLLAYKKRFFSNTHFLKIPEQEF